MFKQNSAFGAVNRFVSTDHAANHARYSATELENKTI